VSIPPGQHPVPCRGNGVMVCSGRIGPAVNRPELLPLNLEAAIHQSHLLCIGTGGGCEGFTRATGTPQILRATSFAHCATVLQPLCVRCDLPKGL
jgi:hypothetical protein